MFFKNILADKSDSSTKISNHGRRDMQVDLGRLSEVLVVRNRILEKKVIGQQRLAIKVEERCRRSWEEEGTRCW